MAVLLRSLVWSLLLHSLVRKNRPSFVTTPKWLPIRASLSVVVAVNLEPLRFALGL